MGASWIATWARFVDKRTGAVVRVYNVHFDHQSQPSRARSAACLADHIARHRKPDERIVALGDFNAGENNPAIAYLLGARPAPDDTGANDPAIALRDTFRIVYPEAVDVGTFGTVCVAL